MNFLVIIPARFYSTRFPGKPLAEIHGKPMIIRVMEQALKSGADRVIVATDSIKIAQVVALEKAPVEVCLTRSDHQSGTERIEEVAMYYKFSDHQIIVNLQGDEPLVTSAMVRQVAYALTVSNRTSMATLATPLHSLQDANNKNIVKVVIDMNNNALYFSRSMIPWCHYNFFNKNQIQPTNVLLQHIGIYAYRAFFLHRYVKWSKSPLEELEILEQLRVLWRGEKIYVSLVKNANNIVSVDTLETLIHVNKLFK